MTRPRAALLAACALLWSACGRESGPDAEDEANKIPDNESAPPADAEFASLTGDPVRGERVFARCAVCHVMDEGVHRVGPSLHAIVGERAGRIEGFISTEANRDSGITWAEEELFEYLRDPAAKIPGTISAFQGLEDPQDRADMVAYLAARTELAAREEE